MSGEEISSVLGNKVSYSTIRSDQGHAGQGSASQVAFELYYKMLDSMRMYHGLLSVH